MRPRDVIRFSLHSMRYNVTRTVITAFIVTAVGALCMTLGYLVNNFGYNTRDMFKEVFQREGTSYTIYNDGRDRSENLKDEDYDFILETSERYADVVTDMSMELNQIHVKYLSRDGNSQSYYPMSFQTVYQFFGFPYSYREDTVLEGRIWSPDDRMSENIWITPYFLKEYAKSGTVVGVGDRISLEIMNGYAPDGMRLEVRIAGILREPEDRRYSGTEGSIFMSAEYVIERCLPSNRSDFFGTISASYRPVARLEDFGPVYERVESYVNTINEKLPVKKKNAFEELFNPSTRVYCQAVVDIQASMTLLAVLNVASAILSGLLILLTVGSLSNSIIISVDKSRKFFGLLKAMGIKQRQINRIVRLESLFTILLGILISTVLVLSLSGVYRNLIDYLFTMIGYPVKGFVLTFSFPFFIPIATFTGFVLFAFLFASGSLRKMARRDSISIINEVA